MLSISLVLLSSFLASSLNVFYGVTSLINNFQVIGFKASTCFFPCPSIVFICFLNPLPSGEYVNLACFNILLLSDDNIFLPVR